MDLDTSSAWAPDLRKETVVEDSDYVEPGTWSNAMQEAWGCAIPDRAKIFLVRPAFLGVSGWSQFCPAGAGSNFFQVALEQVHRG